MGIVIPVIDRRVVNHVPFKRKPVRLWRIGQPNRNGENHVHPQVLEHRPVLNEQLLQLLGRDSGLVQIFHYKKPLLPGLFEHGLTANIDQPVAETPDLPPVWADPHSLLQVLLNLTKNSERALAEEATKRIEISARATGNEATIRVTDSGPGIQSPEMLFQPFQKGAQSTGRASTYREPSCVPSTGTCGTTRPCPAAPSSSSWSWPARAKAASRQRANMTPIRLLLLDDHVLFRESLSRLLASEADFRMAGDCGTVAEALDLLQRTPVDVVLLDYDLGDDHGSQFISGAPKTLRKEQRGQKRGSVLECGCPLPLFRESRTSAIRH